MIVGGHTHAVLDNVRAEALLIFPSRDAAPVEAHSDGGQRICSILSDARNLVEAPTVGHVSDYFCLGQPALTP